MRGSQVQWWFKTYWRKLGGFRYRPRVFSLSPNTCATGATVATVTVTGSYFVTGAIVNFNGTNKATTFVNATTLTFAVTSTDSASAGTKPVYVLNTDGQTSATLFFTVT